MLNCLSAALRRIILAGSGLMCPDLCPADLQRGLPNPRQRRHRHSVSVRGEDQPERHRRQRGGPQRDLQNPEGQRGHVHPEVGQRRR